MQNGGFPPFCIADKGRMGDFTAPSFNTNNFIRAKRATQCEFNRRECIYAFRCGTDKSVPYKKNYECRNPVGAVFTMHRNCGPSGTPVPTKWNNRRGRCRHRPEMREATKVEIKIKNFYIAVR